MNIIIPEDEKVSDVIFDLRDFPGIEKDLWKKKSAFTKYLFYVPREMFVNDGESASFEQIVKNIKEDKIPKVKEHISNIKKLEDVMAKNDDNLSNFLHTLFLTSSFDFFDKLKKNFIKLPSDEVFAVPVELTDEGLTHIIYVGLTDPSKDLRTNEQYQKMCEIKDVQLDNIRVLTKVLLPDRDDERER